MFGILSAPQVLKDSLIQELEKPYTDNGSAYGELLKSAAKPALTYGLSGRLYASATGWLLLSVPNAFVRGLFDALHIPGAELPTVTTGKLNAHITVMSKDEVDEIGGIDKITERGHQFKYTLGPLRECKPSGWVDVSKCWFVEVSSPELKSLRKSYGLTALPHNNTHEFHITVAIQRKHVLGENNVTKHNTKVAVDVERGGLVSRAVGNTIGQVGNALTLSPLLVSRDTWRNPNKNKEKHEDTARLLESVRPQELSDVKLRLGGTKIISDLMRVIHNKRLSPVGKVLGLPATALADTLSPLMRISHYNPYSNTIAQYYDSQPITEQELGRAIDYNKNAPSSNMFGLNRLKRDAYALAQTLPGFNTYQTGAGTYKSRKALEEALRDKPDELVARDIERQRTLPATVASAVGTDLVPLTGVPLAGPLALITKLINRQHAIDLKDNIDKGKKYEPEGTSLGHSLGVSDYKEKKKDTEKKAESKPQGRMICIKQTSMSVIHGLDGKNVGKLLEQLPESIKKMFTKRSDDLPGNFFSRWVR